MKKIFYLFCLLAATLAVACTHEEEDLFGDSSANRADATIFASIEVLTEASNGWLMEYFPASAQEYGGYNLLLDFNTDGTVQVAGEVANPDDVTTGLYSVKQSAGIVLSFDTYNEIFHFSPTQPFLMPGERATVLRGITTFWCWKPLPKRWCSWERRRRVLPC